MAECDTICPTVEYHDLKKDPQHFVEVCAEIIGLRRTITGTLNAIIDVAYTERSFVLSVELNSPRGTADVTRFRYEVKRLPAEIDPDKSRYKVKPDKVIILLCKAVPGSWSKHLASIGLEHEQDAP